MMQLFSAEWQRHDQTLTVASGIMPFIEEANQKLGSEVVHPSRRYQQYDYYQIPHYRWCNLQVSSTASPKKRSKKPPTEGQRLEIPDG